MSVVVINDLEQILKCISISSLFVNIGKVKVRLVLWLCKQFNS